MEFSSHFKPKTLVPYLNAVVDHVLNSYMNVRVINEDTYEEIENKISKTSYTVDDNNFFENLLCIGIMLSPFNNKLDLNFYIGQNLSEVKKLDYLYIKEVTFKSQNAIKHIKEWTGYDLQINHTYYFTFHKVYQDEYISDINLGITIIHQGTFDYLRRIRYTKPPNNYLKLIKLFKTIIKDHHRLSTMMFGSMSLALYGIFDKQSNRPRDVDFWFINDLSNKINDEIMKLSEDDRKYFDYYGTELSVDSTSKKSMAERLFKFYQMSVNAGIGTKYIVKDSKDINRGNKFKAQVSSNPGSGPFLIVTFNDIFFNTKNSVFAYGVNTLCIEMEVFRKHLRFLDRCLKISSTNFDDSNWENICGKNTNIPKDQQDYEKISDKIKNGEIPPLVEFNGNVDLYLKYLGLDGNLDVPFHKYSVYASVSNESAYKSVKNGIKIPEITYPSVDKKKLLKDYVLFGFPNKIKTEIGKDFRKTVVQSENGKFSIDTYTRKSDLLSGKAFSNQKVFRNVSLKSLPPSPIQSNFGNNLPSTWLWILTTDGALDVLLVTSGFELVNKHLSLAYKTPNIIGAGELRVQSNGDIIFNLESGTYVKSSFFLKNGLENTQRWYSAIQNYFAVNLGKKWFTTNRLFFTNNIVIPSGTRPLISELIVICDKIGLEDRIYLHDYSNNEFYLSKEEFENYKSKRGNYNVCSKLDLQNKVLSEFPDVSTAIPDLDTRNSKFTPIKYDLDQIYSDANITSPSSSISKNTFNVFNKTITTSYSKCNVFKEGLSIIKILSATEKSSASASKIIFAKIKFSHLRNKKFLKAPSSINNAYNNYVVLKISYSNRDNLGLVYESMVYRYLTEKLVFKHITPCISSYVTSFRGVCEKMRNYLLTDSSMGPVTNEINVTMTEWLAGKSISQLLKENYIFSYEDIVSIVFQVAWTCHSMNKVGCTHNDLHAGNVFITTLKEKTPFTFFIKEDGTHFRLNTRYIIKIYDFDRSYVEELGLNPILSQSYEESVGAGNYIKSETDITLFLCRFYSELYRHRTNYKIGNDGFDHLVRFLKEIDYYDIFRSFMKRADGQNQLPKDISVNGDMVGWVCTPCIKSYNNRCTRSKTTLWSSRAILAKLITFKNNKGKEILSIKNMNDMSVTDFPNYKGDLDYFLNEKIETSEKRFGKFFVGPDLDINIIRNVVTKFLKNDIKYIRSLRGNIKVKRKKEKEIRLKLNSCPEMNDKTKQYLLKRKEFEKNMKLVNHNLSIIDQNKFNENNYLMSFRTSFFQEEKARPTVVALTNSYNLLNELSKEIKDIEEYFQKCPDSTDEDFLNKINIEKGTLDNYINIFKNAMKIFKELFTLTTIEAIEQHYDGAAGGTYETDEGDEMMAPEEEEFDESKTVFTEFLNKLKQMNRFD